MSAIGLFIEALRNRLALEHGKDAQTKLHWSNNEHANKFELGSAMRRLLMAMAGLGWICGPAVGTDYFVTIGGGPTPQNNQLSLEKNVQFFQRTIAQCRSDQPHHEIFFADGSSDRRDLQYQEAEPTESEAVQWMSSLLSAEDSLGLKYRSHQVTPVSGPARKAYIQQTFDRLASSAKAGDRVIVYVAAHGGSADESDELFDYGYSDSYASDPEELSYDTSIALWNDETLSMKEFTKWLDLFPADVEVLTIMVQCYAGGFAHEIYHDGNDKLGLNHDLRAGFFSQRFDRPSAGCTPEVLEENYQDYSTFFFAALCGMNRLGETIESADYDGNSRVSFAEAHAYAVVTSETIDIPMRTSGEILRRFSKFGTAAEAKDEDTQDVPAAESLGAAMATLFAGGQREDKPKALTIDAAGLVTRQSTVEGLLDLATPDQRVIVEKLTEILNVKSDARLQQIKGQFRRTGENLEKREQAYGIAQAEYSVLISQLIEAVKAEYPEFSEFGYSPVISELTGSRADEFTGFIAQQSQAAALDEIAERMTTLVEKMEAVEVREARLGRLVQTLEEILLEENLLVVASDSVVEQYRRVLAMEQGTLSVE
jgi:hypothetical protein